jgi:multimeric flavodoxin WrbA
LTKTPSKCVQDDDVKMLLPKVQDADVIAIATPVCETKLYAKLASVEQFYVTALFHHSL